MLKSSKESSSQIPFEDFEDNVEFSTSKQSTTSNLSPVSGSESKIGSESKSIMTEDKSFESLYSQFSTKKPSQYGKDPLKTPQANVSGNSATIHSTLKAESNVSNSQYLSSFSIEKTSDNIIEKLPAIVSAQGEKFKKTIEIENKPPFSGNVTDFYQQVYQKSVEKQINPNILEEFGINGDSIQLQNLIEKTLHASTTQMDHQNILPTYGFQQGSTNRDKTNELKNHHDNTKAELVAEEVD